MMNMPKMFSAAVFTLLVAFVASGSLGAAPLATDCEITFEPESVTAGTERAIVQVTTSEEVTEVDGVVADPESGLLVTLDQQTRGLQLQVNATEAQEGEWEVTLRNGDEAVCTGDLTVDGPGLL